MSLLKELKKDNLSVKIYETRAAMGSAAADEASRVINELLLKKDCLNIVFAAAPSQNELLAELSKKDIDWSRINAFHMDEYIGLLKGAKQSFGMFLKEHIFDKVPFKNVYYIADYMEDYEKLISENHIDLVLMGIGENGHIAFNDPWEADFNDSKLIKRVKLDEVCRQQQVNDGCFPNIDAVPKEAYTVTIPAMVSADYLVCVVPASTKREAVKRTVNDDISEECPATIMRRHKNALMYCDKDSGADLL